MRTFRETTGCGPGRAAATGDFFGWLRRRPLHYLIAAVVATALASGYLVASLFVQAFERHLASQSLLALVRMTEATRDATPTLAPLLKGSCGVVLNDLRRQSSLVPYLRAAILVHGERAQCSSRLGVEDYPLTWVFFRLEPGQPLALIPGTAYVPGKPLLTVFHRVHDHDGILFLIEARYLEDVLRVCTAGGADRAWISVRGSGALSDTGQYSYQYRPMEGAPDTTVTGEGDAVSVSVHLSARKRTEIIALVELAFGLLGVLLAGLGAVAYLGAFAPDQRLLRAVGTGLAGNEFFLVYQPLVDVATRRWIGAEALIRWNHPTLGPLSPQAFIDAVEGSALIEEMTRFVLKRALADMAVLGVPPGWHLAVNVTPRSICSPGFATQIATTVRESGTVCTVTVEVTERELFGSDHGAVTALNALRRAGLSLAVDDFGTENSNLDLLSRYDFDYLKIDRQYTARLGTDRSGLPEGICALARHLHATVIAEGVEREVQHQALLKLGVTMAQGYLYQKPAAIDEFAGLYATQRASHGAPEPNRSHGAAHGMSSLELMSPVACDDAADEAGRQATLARYNIMDTAREPEFDRIVRVASALFDMPMALISLVDSERQWFKASVGVGAMSETPRCIAFCSFAIQFSEVMVVADAAQDERFRTNPLVAGEPRIRFYAGAPLRMPNGHRIGTLCVLDTVPRVFDAGQRALLQDLAAVVAEQIEARQRTALLTDMLKVDALTGVLSRRYFFELAEKAFDRARRDQAPCAAMMIDIDHFKRVNDVHGHQIGDAVLQVVGEILDQTLGTRALVGRIGGEEFAAVLLSADLVQARLLAQACRSAIAGIEVNGRTASTVRITASVGLACMRAGDASFSDMLRRADLALLDAKQAGRNCLVEA